MSELKTLTFAITGMHCASCGMLVDETLEELDGVERCEADSRRGRAVVLADTATASISDITAAIAKAGYTASLLNTSAPAIPSLSPKTKDFK